MKKEVEIKVRVESLDPLISKLKEQGIELAQPVTQDDMVFVNYEGSYDLFPEGANYLRIRQTKDRAYFTLKCGDEMNSIERETIIDDPQQMKEALIFMGYKEVVQVIKTRQKAKFKEYEICLDEVQGLGTFVEVEKITDEDSEKVQQEMLGLLTTFNIDIKERIFNGYDTLVWKKTQLEK